MAEQTTDTTSSTTTGTGWISVLGWALIAIGLLGAVLMWSDMSSSSGLGELDYPAAEKWRAVLTGLAVSGLGAVTVAVGEVASRLPRRD